LAINVVVALSLVGVAAYLAFGAGSAEVAVTTPVAVPTTLTTEIWVEPPVTAEPEMTVVPRQTLAGDGGMAPTTPPGQVGLVAIEPHPATDPRAPAIAGMFHTYFAGINGKDYTAVGTVLDPAGTVDPTSAKEMAALERGTATTQDSDISLVAIRDALGAVQAQVRFRSTQDAGAGPKGRSSETCTQWAIDYELSHDDASGYRILGGAAEHRPC
jgi:hypothetical protein